MRKFESTPYSIATGVSITPSPLVVGTEFLRDARNVDTYEEFGAVGKIPGSTVKSPNLGGAVDLLEFFQFFDTSGVQRRQVVAAADGNLYRVESPSDRILLESGMVAEFLKAAATEDRLYIAGPSNTPLKYDGAKAYRAGVLAPGQREIPIEALDVAADWTVVGCTAADDSDSKDLGGSVNLTRATIDANSTVSASKTITAADLTSAPSGLVYYWIQIPTGLLEAITQVEIGLSDGTNENLYRAQLGNLREAWNLVAVPTTAPDVDNGATLSAITDLAFRISFAGTGYTFTGLKLDNLHMLEEGAPAGVLNGAGAITGTVTYVATYVTKFGIESNAGPPSAGVTAASNAVRVGGIPRSTDPQVIARRLYRDLDGDSTWRLVAQINDNTTDFYEDNTSFAGLSTLTPPLAADTSKDNSPPERLADVAVWNGMVFGINAERRFELNQSEDGERWPIANIRQFDQDLIALVPHALGLFIVGSDSLIQVTGSAWSNLVFDLIHPERSIGVSGKRAWAPAKRVNYQWHDEGVYVNDGIDPWWITGPILKKIREELEESEFSSIHMVFDRRRFRLVIFARQAVGGAYTRCWVFQTTTINRGVISPDGSGVDPKDLRVGGWYEIRFPSAMDPRCSAYVEGADEMPELWVGSGDGHLYQMQDPASTRWRLADTPSELIEAYFRTGWLFGGERKLTMPRLIDVDFYTDRMVTIQFTARIAKAPNDDDDTGVTSIVKTVTLHAGAHDLAIPLPRKVRGRYVQVEVRDDGSDAMWRVRGVSLRHNPRAATASKVA